MSVIELIQQLDQQNIRLWLEDGQLRFSAPKGGMSDALRNQLRHHKAAIIEFLSSNQKLEGEPIHTVDSTQSHVLSYAQERIWFLHQLGQNSDALHLQHLFEIRGNLDKQRLLNALNTVVQRHNILRTAYQQTGTGTRQNVLAAKAFTLNEIQAPKAGWSENKLNTLLLEESQKPFNLHAGEVFRHCLIELSEQHYWLLSTLHHIATDGWSMNIMAKEIVTLYLSGDIAHALPAPELQYQDFAVWQHQQNHQALFDQQLRYWQQQLANINSLQLPSDSPALGPADPQGASYNFIVDTQYTHQLNQLASRQQCSLFMLLLAVFSTLLHRYSQQDNFCIGIPVAGRNHPQLESILGCFVNMLAIRCQHDELRFDEHLANIRDTLLQAFANQDVPFEQVVQHTLNQRDLSITPLFQVMFALQNTPLATDNTLEELAIEALNINKNASLYDLSLNIHEWQGELLVEFTYRSALFSRAAIERMADSFKQIIATIVTAPQTPIFTLPIVSPSERQRQLEQWNNTQVTRNEYPLLHHYIEQQAIQNPDAIALVYAEQALSYRQLNIQANQLAHAIQAQNQQPFVGVYLERSQNLPIALLAVLKAGFAYLPLDTAYPAQRLAYIIEQAQLSLIITDNTVDHAFLPADISCIHLPLTVDELAEYSEIAPVIEQQEQEKALFNLIYTSGSSGQPKGVKVSHRAIINRLLWMQETFSINSTHRVLHKTPYSFDVSVWEIFWPLMQGAPLYILPPKKHGNAVFLSAFIEQHQITHLHFVPSMLSAFLQQTNKENCATLEVIISSGESLSAPLAQRCLNLLPQTQLYNLYGPTEAAVDVSFHACQVDDSPIPIGRPIANTQLYITDSHQQLLPLGVTGEILISGRNLAEGYLQDGAQQAAFIPHPFITGERAYRTGDLGYFDELGRLYFVGRQDQQIKIRGFRVELREIEQHLVKHPKINEAIVLARPVAEDDLRIVAYFICNQEKLDTDTLRNFLKETLPDFMLPNYFIQLDAWPVGQHGKIDTQQLPSFEQSISHHQQHILPRNDTEQAIAMIWSDLLHVQDIGIYDSFFSLGGHSLLASMAISRIQEHFDVNIPLAEIFNDPSIATIAKVVQQTKKQQKIIIDGPLNEGEHEIHL